MNHLPLGKARTGAAAQLPLPLPFAEMVALVKASPALDAFARKRVGHMTIGHTPDADLDLPPAHIARQAKSSLSALIDAIGPQRMNLPPLSRTDCLKRIESAGAMLIALWERVQADVPDET